MRIGRYECYIYWEKCIGVGVWLMRGWFGIQIVFPKLVIRKLSNLEMLFGVDNVIQDEPSY